MGSASCQWVREWLPLFVEERDGLPGDQGDLSPDDCGRIEEHLSGCPACRARQSDLAGVMSILGLVAAEPPIDRDPGSILPAVDEQIEWHRTHSRSPWCRLWRALGIAGSLGVPAPPGQAFARLRCERPLQIAWLRDSLRDRLGDAAARLRARPERRAPGRRWLPAPGLELRVALTMAGMLVGAFLLAASLHQRRAAAEARIAANAMPIPGMEVADRDAWPGLEAHDLSRFAASLADPDGEPRRHEPAASTEPVAVALASPPPPPRAAGITGPASPAASPSADPATAATSSAPRYDFVLERGTPMPPESRVGKPAY